MNFIKHWQHKNERITPAFGPHAPYTVSPEHIRQVADKARELNAPVTMHLAEAATEVADILSRYENTPVKHVATLGLLDISLIAAHMVHPSDAEIAL
ncbi:MAG: amidohydrolase family protein, partial [Planctomycetes bacterium]|nr:amidohydrolase family protein [Planctomycetota bacterium]